MNNLISIVIFSFYTVCFYRFPTAVSISTYQTSKLKYWSSYFFSLYFLSLFLFTRSCAVRHQFRMGERIERRDLRDLEKCAITQNKMEEESVTDPDGRTVNTTNYAHFKHDQKHTVTPNSQPDNNRKNSELHIKVICKSITSYTKVNFFFCIYVLIIWDLNGQFYVYHVKYVFYRRNYVTGVFSLMFILTETLSEFDPMLPLNDSELVAIGKHLRLGALHRNFVREFQVELELLHLYCIQMTLIHIYIRSRDSERTSHIFHSITDDRVCPG